MFKGLGKEDFAVVLLISELIEFSVSELMGKCRGVMIPYCILADLVNIARKEKVSYKSYIRINRAVGVLEEDNSFKSVLALFYTEYKFRKSINKIRMINILLVLEKYLVKIKKVNCNFNEYINYIRGLNV